MKLWISKNSEVPVHDQLIAQITLGIASNDLAPGERLPSTRELARRFRIHQNTVSTAYRKLTEQGLVTLKKGSGVYVANSVGTDTQTDSLNHLFARFVEHAVGLGYSAAEIRKVIDQGLAETNIRRILVVESDESLREILVSEIESATDVSTVGIATEDLTLTNIEDEVKLVAMADERAKLDRVPDVNGRCTYLEPNSVPEAMQGQERPSVETLTAIVSGWEKFVSLARLFLLAADVDSATIITRSTRDRDWRKASEPASIIICDSLTARQFAGDDRVRVFPLIACDSLDALRRSIRG
jgi:DNA-binding transcriptional regulator YhcF (GntR family)